MARASNRERGLTIIELLVVISIIAILTGVLLSSFGGSRESANAVKCMSNLRNLGAAANNFCLSGAYSYQEGDAPPNANPTELAIAVQSARNKHNKCYPCAGSLFWGTYYDFNRGHDVAHFNGWVSAQTQNQFPWYNILRGAGSVSARASFAYDPLPANRAYALTNGCLWKYMGQRADAYVCPTHAAAMRKKKLVPAWSYVMNSAFGYDVEGKMQELPSGIKPGTIEFGDVKGPEHMLLFAELPFAEIDGLDKPVFSEGSRTDSVLQFDDRVYREFSESVQPPWKGDKECVGFNHPMGKRGYCAHVLFADGHVAKVQMPNLSGAGPLKADKKNALDLTRWMCSGWPVSYNGSSYALARTIDGENN